MQKIDSAIVLSIPKSKTSHTFAPINGNDGIGTHTPLEITFSNYTGNQANIGATITGSGFHPPPAPGIIDDGNSSLPILISPMYTDASTGAGIYNATLNITGPGGFSASIALSYGLYHYFITNAEQLSWIANPAFSHYPLSGIYLLDDDIDLDIPETNPWTPIGTDTDPFNGTFDGNGKTVSGLTVVSPSGDYQGLFGYIGGSGVVKNLSVVGNVTGRNYIGGVVGYNFEGTVQNCHSNVVVVGDSWVGGVVGNNDGGNVQYSYSNGSITGNSSIGGMVGGNSDSNGMVQYCYSEAVVVGNVNNGGGVVGYNTAATLQNCVALNPSVTRGSGTAETYGRVASIPAVGGGGDPGTLNNNHARDNMVFIPEPPPSSPYAFAKEHDGKDGADMTMAQAGTRAWWTGTAGWTVHADKSNAYEGSPWYWDTAVNRPKLFFE